jgi:outer membrane receptor for ferrienterochelin and colicin
MNKAIIKIIKAIVFFLMAQPVLIQAQTVVTGQVTDEKMNEPLPGVYVLVSGSAKGCVTDNEGIYNLPLEEGTYTLEFRYISYQTTVTEPVIINGEPGKITMNVQMIPGEMSLEEVFVTARKNLETEKSLLSERRMSSAALENMGAREMNEKGISTVAEGVKKITGISLAETGQVFVRGLGDRYSTTTLNGMPIASPNPDNKLIPLELFPAGIIRNVTVSKVYNASSYADYSGAHIDISVKEHTGTDFFTINAGTGGSSGSVFSPFYRRKNKGGMLLSGNLSPEVKKMTANEFSSYVRNNDPFETSFSVSGRMLLPGINGGIGMGKTWTSGRHKTGLLISMNAGYSGTKEPDSYVSTINAQGTVLNAFNYDSYTTNLDIAALMHLSHEWGTAHYLSYSLLYARNAEDNYKEREGYDSEGIRLIGSNSVLHTYNLLNHQILYAWTSGTKWSVHAAFSYGMTGSYEPDRRQVMFRVDNGTLSLFKLNKQETMRYFGELEEQEAAAHIYAVYNLGERASLRFGASYKNKVRDYSSVRFYYNLNNLNPEITDIHNTDAYLNNANIADGTIIITKDAQPKSSYYAGQNVGGVYLQADMFPFTGMNINLGLRYEPSVQWVRYRTDASIEKISSLKGHDIFPAINMKYGFGKDHFLRLALSRTVTRPLFIEMAPFLYKESYGSAEIRGNESLVNGYNMNADLRYEVYGKNNNLFSATLYYKYLKTPIERVQESSGGSAVHSFRNASEGMAAGIEVETRINLFPGLRTGFNASYMYTNVILPEGGGIYTDSRRALQGASPYLINADLAYGWKVRKSDQITLTVLYNLQGPRIHAVGIYGMGNVMQMPLHTLDFVGIYNYADLWNIKVSAGNVLDSRVRYIQEVKTTGEFLTVESYKPGISFQIGFSYTFK